MAGIAAEPLKSELGDTGEMRTVIDDENFHRI
jgi:hypothetical protein